MNDSHFEYKRGSWWDLKPYKLYLRTESPYTRNPRWIENYLHMVRQIQDFIQEQIPNPQFNNYFWNWDRVGQCFEFRNKNDAMMIKLSYTFGSTL